ncbi:UNVERIFIED_CONTAM: hypothetical protein Q9R58_08885 [Methylobacteriaceae bacterium AG10]|nr:hypothetical protein [Methylobacteriaceae bacterium AG10]
MGDWYKKRSAADFSFFAIFVLLFAQVYTFKLIHGANVQIYIENNPTYESSIKSMPKESGGRSGIQVFRLRYQMHHQSASIDCDIIKKTSDIGPYFSNVIRVTPKGLTCEDPYLTDFEYWPKANSLTSATLTFLASILLVISSLKLKKQVDRLTMANQQPKSSVSRSQTVPVDTGH